jgi:hypothetical protein
VFTFAACSGCCTPFSYKLPKISLFCDNKCGAIKAFVNHAISLLCIKFFTISSLFSYTISIIFYHDHSSPASEFNLSDTRRLRRPVTFPALQVILTMKKKGVFNDTELKLCLDLTSNGSASKKRGYAYSTTERHSNATGCKRQFRS